MAFTYWYGIDGGKTLAKECLNNLFQYTDSVMSPIDKDLLEKNDIHQYDFLNLKRDIYNYEIYKSLINQGSIYFQNGNYHEALEKYLTAHSIREKEREAILKIESVKKAISIKYSEMIINADKFFRINHLDSALIYYQKSLHYKPKEEYPKSQINVIIKKNENLKNQMNYDRYISNNDIVIEIFDNAFKNYQELYNYLPSIQYNAEFTGANGSDLLINYQYGISDTSLTNKESLFVELSKNNFPLGQYYYEGAYLAIKIIKDALQSIIDSTNLNINQSNLKTSILGTADGVKFKKPLRYKNDLGKINFATYGIKDKDNNKKLALLRAYFAKRELMTLSIFNEKKITLNIKEYENKIGGEYRKVIITIKINGAKDIIYNNQSSEVKDKIRLYYQPK